MKRALSAVLAVFMIFILSGCDSSDYKKAVKLYDQGEYAQAREIFAELEDYEDSQEKLALCDIEISIEECNNAIEQLQLGSSVSYYDVKFSLNRFKKAFDLYNAVPPEQKNRITDAEKLLAAQVFYEQCCAEPEIESQVMAEAVRMVKDHTALYAAISTFKVREDEESTIFIFWNDDDPTMLNGSIDLCYSYENKYGGTQDREETGYWHGKYENGVFEITDMTFYGLTSELIDWGLSLFG